MYAEARGQDLLGRVFLTDAGFEELAADPLVHADGLGDFLHVGPALVDGTQRSDCPLTFGRFVAADQDAVRLRQILHRCSFCKEFWVGQQLQQRHKNNNFRHPQNNGYTSTILRAHASIYFKSAARPFPIPKVLALMRDSLMSTTVTVISGHMWAMMLHVGPPTYPAPMQQILFI
ncbi:hypothetical protein EYF80_020391 [Liparis tanakae]|uniref:Uncharacterized protein n=1 Tax=Liparis tanakae TaxID=230148 RepID=A0A4Z2HUT6_9TELE|nr:hypothetical protein EYF80_020391 [Liparis tanakae]